MGRDSGIEWTHHTFNPVWGCVKVSEGCRNCYAETLSNRFSKGIWGAKAQRRTFSEKHWNDPVRWNRAAKEAGHPHRVFCGSMCDIFEDHPTTRKECEKLWPLIQATPFLDWLLLTKRPENVMAMAPDNLWDLDNVWIGTSVENQRVAKERLFHLIRIPARVRFLSVEPLLGRVDLDHWLMAIDWIIVGGESGDKARPCHPEWVEAIRDLCVKRGIPFFFKQWGRWLPGGHNIGGPTWRHGKAEPSSNPKYLDDEYFHDVGKRVAGRLLDGKSWDQFPEPRKFVTALPLFPE